MRTTTIRTAASTAATGLLGGLLVLVLLLGALAHSDLGSLLARCDGTYAAENLLHH